MGILPCFLMVFLWADISTFVSCITKEDYDTYRANLVSADLANSIYANSSTTEHAAFDAYVSHVVSEAIAKMTQTGSTFIPYRRYNAKMEEELKKLDVYKLVHDMPKPVLLNAQFPLNMTPLEILTAIKGAIEGRKLYVGSKAAHPTQLFVDGDPNLAEMEKKELATDKNIVDYLSSDDDYLENASPRKYWHKMHGILKYLENLLKFKEVIRHLVVENVNSLKHEGVEYAEIRAFFPVTIYTLKNLNALPEENFPNVMQEAVKDYNNEKQDNFEVKLIFLIDRDLLRTANLLQEYNRFVSVYTKNKDMVVGFDVFGLEKEGSSIGDIIKVIGTEHLNVFFAHVGENPNYSEDVLWAGAAKLKRIAGGFTLPFHPVVMDELMPELKCLELVPLSRTTIQGVDVLVAPERSIVVSNTERKDYEKVTIGKGIGRQNLTAQYVAYLLFYQKFYIGWKGLKQIVENSMRNACNPSRFNELAQVRWNNEFTGFIRKYSKIAREKGIIKNDAQNTD